MELYKKFSKNLIIGVIILFIIIYNTRGQSPCVSPLVLENGRLCACHYKEVNIEKV